ncbi:MAG: antibiotic biosynthesis monooxygenase [Flavobacteriales bacterium]|nr:antibiotic biosynthesis monooxygenase [Flavobacteriales bacterium]
MFAKTPPTPYYTVIFSSQRTDVEEGYTEMNDSLWNDAQKLEGFIGAESLRGGDGFGVTVLYFKDKETIHEWSKYQKHLRAKELGKEKWYEGYRVRIAKVEREYGMGE